MENNNPYLDFNVTGTERKRLVQAVSDFTGADARYLGAPSFAYQVDRYHIDRSGVVSFDAQTDREEVEGLVAALVERGFVAQISGLDREGEEVPAEDPSGEPAPNSAAQEGNTLTIQMPAASFTAEALNNLHSLIAAKGKLIRKALGVDLLPVQVGEDTVSFPWFSSEATGEEVKAYTHLITALCDMARNQKRITAKEKDTDNEKYAFRCFLLRLGFIGAEYKEERKILLRNLTGSSAFKSGQRSSEAIQPEPPNATTRVEVQGDPALAEALADELMLQQVNASFGEGAAL